MIVLELAPKERPILFSAPMVRALLAGTKTQTRRVVKWPDWLVPDDYDKAAWELRTMPEIALMEDGRPVEHFGCPYGRSGDRLWVRETWAGQKGRPLYMGHYFYRADGERTGEQGSLSYYERENRWRPSIHMPRHVSRITLEVTGVRVEQLQYISEVDALAEGATQYKDKDPDYGYAGWYRALWESINGPESWASNPWVWVVEFKRLSPQGSEK